MSASKKKQESRTNRLMRRLADGLIGWMTFQRAGKAFPYLEAMLYQPIRDIAVGRGWRVVPQFKLPRKSSSTIDFAFFLAGSPQHHQMTRAILLEVKFVSDRTGHAHKLAKDIEKMTTVDSGSLGDSKSISEPLFDEIFELHPEIKLRRFALIAGEKENVRAYLRSAKDEPFAPDALALWATAFDDDGHARTRGKAKSPAGLLRHSPAFLKYDHIVMLLRETPRWRKET